MKKKPALMALTAALVFFTGCTKAPTALGDPIDYTSVSYISPNNDPAGIPDNKGEPTFLICPDGTPVYTSEILSIYTDDSDITLEEAEQLAREGGDFTVVCSGFVYGYLPDLAYNRIDDPKLFKDQGDGVNFSFIGEKTPPSTEFTRFEVGGRIGSLTVKNALTYFGSPRGYTNNREYSDKPGFYLLGGSAEFDGEIGLSGYVSVAPLDVMYGVGGGVTFYPDSGSCHGIPVVGGNWNKDVGGFAHSPSETFYGYYGSVTPEFGSIDELTADTGSLKPGDSFVKAVVTIENIGYTFRPEYEMTTRHFTLKDINL